MDARPIHQLRTILHPHIGEPEIPHRWNTFDAGNRILILKSAAEQIKTQEPATGSGNIQIVGYDVFNERAAAHARLDVERERLRFRKFAMLHSHIPYAA